MAEGLETQFRAALAEGRLAVPSCADCGGAHFFPRVLCPHCHSPRVVLKPAQGRGTIYATTCVRRRAEKGGDYNVCMVELAEGARMMSRVEGIAPDRVEIGQRVTLFVGEIDGAPAILCRPEEG